MGLNLSLEYRLQEVEGGAPAWIANLETLSEPPQRRITRAPKRYKPHLLGEPPSQSQMLLPFVKTCSTSSETVATGMASEM